MPLRLLILGDWCGRASRPTTAPAVPLANRRPIRVDRDNLDEVIRQLGVELHVPAGTTDDACMAIRSTELNDFYPDCLFLAYAL
jgi:predicted component of type VI protein secretion system